jgi:hypothetical protein
MAKPVLFMQTDWDTHPHPEMKKKKKTRAWWICARFTPSGHKKQTAPCCLSLVQTSSEAATFFIPSRLMQMDYN